MRYLLDTNILCKQDTYGKARGWILQHYLQIGISSVTVAEIAGGIEALPPSKRRSDLEAFLNELVQDYTVYPFGLEEAYAWARYINQVKRPVPRYDSLIAATALANNMEVVTENVADFPGLKVINPLKA
jgi:predicted nucleic acid-binding protein